MSNRPKPAALRTGHRTKAELLDGGMTPPPGIPDPPTLLEGEALAEWWRLAVALTASGVLAVTDRNLLARYCQLWSRWLSLEASGADANLSLKTDDSLRKMEIELGLTPAARTRVKPVKQPAAMDDLEAFNRA